MRALLPEMFEPSGSASTFVKSKFAMSCCWSSSCDGALGFLVLVGDAGCTCADVLAPAPIARAAARVEGPVPAWCVLDFLVSRRALFAASAALALAAASSFLASVSAVAAIAAAFEANAAYASAERFVVACVAAAVAAFVPIVVVASAFAVVAAANASTSAAKAAAFA